MHEKKNKLVIIEGAPFIPFSIQIIGRNGLLYRVGNIIGIGNIKEAKESENHHTF